MCLFLFFFTEPTTYQVDASYLKIQREVYTLDVTTQKRLNMLKDVHRPS